MPQTINMGIPGASSSVTGGVTGKRVLLAEPRGYCAGVDRAVETVERALEKHGAPVYVRHEIVHNRHVVDTLAEAGAVFVDETDEVPEGAIVVFSAHGVAPTVHTSAAERKLQVIDATCPLVTKVHNEAKRFARDDYDILLIGHEGHEEVVGTAGEAPDHVQLVDGPDAVDGVTVRDENKVIWLSQTTLSVDETMETVQRLRQRFPKLQDPPSDDICYATQNRQVAVKAMAPECQLVIVVGSRNSSNSVRLVEVALGETPGTTEIHVFAGLPHGHASVSTLDRSDYSSHRVERHTLDDLLAGSRTPAFVKLDVEGSERDVLRGAEATLAAGCPPIWMIEVNYETSAAFGYRPPDLLEPFGAGHRVFRITDRGLEPEADPALAPNGSNWIVVPDCHADRVRA